jgi:putative tryptophan/tyrosine transport system substrate-binding protein
MNRRMFVAMAGSAAAWPLSSGKAQQPARQRVIGVIMANAESDPEGEERLSLLRGWLGDLGWSDGASVRIDVRWHAGDLTKARTFARELVAQSPDVIVVNGTQATSAVLDATSSIPVVFVVVNNPAGSGFVQNLSRPGGNVTGFSTFEPEIAGKWIELLAELSAGITHAGILFDPAFQGFSEMLAAIDRTAPSLGIEKVPLHATSSATIERAIVRLSAQPHAGLIAMPTPANTAHRRQIFALASERRLPAVYPFSSYARQGGLIAYGFDSHELFKRAAAYVSRILKGESPGDLPVQAPSKFELIINLQTARALDLTIPPALLARADEVIE